MDHPRILIVGAGGIGGVIAAALAEAGTPVALHVRRPELAARLRAGGLRLVERGRTRPVNGPLTVVEDAAGPVDFALLAVPPDQAAAAAGRALPLLAPGGRLVPLCNGLPEERLAASMGPERLLGAVIAFGASSPAPGVAERTSAGGFTVGRPGGAPDAAVERLAGILAAVGPVRVTANLAGVRWSKLAVNCAVSSLGTAGGDRVGPLLRRAFVRRLALRAIGEAVAVARAEGVALEKVGGTVDLGWLAPPPGVSAAGMAARHALLLAVGARYRRLRSSMLAQLERGQVPPVEFLNGEVAARGRLHGIATPVNDALLERIRAFAQGDGRPGLETLRALAGAVR